MPLAVDRPLNTIKQTNKQTDCTDAHVDMYQIVSCVTHFIKCIFSLNNMMMPINQFIIHVAIQTDVISTILYRVPDQPIVVVNKTLQINSKCSIEIEIREYKLCSTCTFV